VTDLADVVQHRSRLPAHAGTCFRTTLCSRKHTQLQSTSGQRLQRLLFPWSPPRNLLLPLRPSPESHLVSALSLSAVQRLLFSLSLPALATRFPACPKTAWVLVGRTLRQRAHLSRSVFLVTSEVFLPGVRTFESCFCQLALTKTKLLVSKPARFQLLRAARTENKVPT
jgi:hypothetical protein